MVSKSQFSLGDNLWAVREDRGALTFKYTCKVTHDGTLNLWLDEHHFASFVTDSSDVPSAFELGFQKSPELVVGGVSY